jgi:hypothetical protein
VDIRPGVRALPGSPQGVVVRGKISEMCSADIAVPRKISGKSLYIISQELFL